MNPLFEYLIKSFLWLTSFYVVYRLLLRNETLLSFNRFFLLTGAIASLVMPLVVISHTVQIEVPVIHHTATPNIQSTAQPITTPGFFQTLQHYLAVVYFIGMIIIAFRTLYSLIPIWRAIHKLQSQSTIIYTDISSAPFSFGRYVFLPHNIEPKDIPLILKHESVHTKERHYIDIWIIKAVCIIQFFHPLAWLYARAVRENCEFMADYQTIKESKQKEDYIQLLVRYCLQSNFNSATLSFAFPLILKRLKIMKQKKSNKITCLKSLAVIPMASAILIAYAQTNTVEVPIRTTMGNIHYQPILAQNTKKASTPNVKSNTPEQTKKKASSQSENTQSEVVVVGYGNGQQPTDKLKTDNDEVFTVADELPKFSDGNVAEYFAKNIRYPADAQKRGVQGRVICQYIVEKDGSISSVNVIRGVDPLIDAEACRVIYTMPKWIPGKQNGKIVRVKYTIPINFHLN